MTVLAVLAQKGGVGKSMLSRSFAVQGLIEGRRTAIIDCDPSGTVTKWGQRRKAPAPVVLPLGERSIAAAVAELQGRGAELVVIDTPPHAQPIISAVAGIGDAAVLVTGPFPEDLEQIGIAAAIVRSLEKPCAIVLNKTPPRAQALTLARAALAAFGVPICPTALTQRMSHPYASAEGLTAQEREPDSQAARELADTWKWLKKNLLVS
jgi:chromosome partitioning protein